MRKLVLFMVVCCLWVMPVQAQTWGTPSYNSISNVAGAITITLTPGRAIVAGDTIAVWCGTVDGGQTVNSVSDGDSFTGATEIASGTKHARWFYLLVAVTTGSPTFTCTFGGSATNRFIGIVVSTPSAVASLDVSSKGASGSSAAPASASFSTSGSAVIVYGGVINGNGGFSAPLVAGAAATASDSDGPGEFWHKVTTVSASTVSITSANAGWVCDAIAFNISAGATFKPYSLPILGAGQK